MESTTGTSTWYIKYQTLPRGSLALQYEQADESGSEAGHGSDHESQSGGREPEAEQAGQTTPVRKDGGAASETPGRPGLPNSARYRAGPWYPGNQSPITTPADGTAYLPVGTRVGSRTP